jgi:hypothetical protein
MTSKKTTNFVTNVKLKRMLTSLASNEEIKTADSLNAKNVNSGTTQKNQRRIITTCL